MSDKNPARERREAIQGAQDERDNMLDLAADAEQKRINAMREELEAIDRRRGLLGPVVGTPEVTTSESTKREVTAKADTAPDDTPAPPKPESPPPTGDSSGPKWIGVVIFVTSLVVAIIVMRLLAYNLNGLSSIAIGDADFTTERWYRFLVIAAGGLGGWYLGDWLARTFLIGNLVRNAASRTTTTDTEA